MKKTETITLLQPFIESWYLKKKKLRNNRSGKVVMVVTREPNDWIAVGPSGNITL
jgi:hypothetical protein